MVIITLPPHYKATQQLLIAPTVWIPYSLGKTNPLIQVPPLHDKNSLTYTPLSAPTPGNHVPFHDPSMPQPALKPANVAIDPLDQQWYPSPKNGKPKSDVPSVQGQIITSMTSATRPTLPPIKLIEAFLPPQPTTYPSVHATVFLDPFATCSPKMCAAQQITLTKENAMEIDNNECSEQNAPPTPPPNNEPNNNDPPLPPDNNEKNDDDTVLQS